MEKEAVDIDRFKAEFKKYKKKDRSIDLTEVIDLSKGSHFCFHKKVERTEVPCAGLCLKPVFGLKSVSEWEIYKFSSSEGFYLVRNPFLPGFQQYWMSRCLADLPQLPNVTNLNVHPDVDPNSIWTEFVKECLNKKSVDKRAPLWKLRWTTLGYHYDWNSKEYSGDRHTPFPEDIGILSYYIASVLGFPGFSPEAGIINYYHLDSTLGGHTDHSELTHQAPLISISFGLDAIFLLGGLTKETKPTAILLHSGDICVMSGMSRLAYHAVPCILLQSAEDFLLHFQSQSEAPRKEHEQKLCKTAGSKAHETGECYVSSTLSSPDGALSCMASSTQSKYDSDHCQGQWAHQHRQFSEGMPQCSVAGTVFGWRDLGDTFLSHVPDMSTDTTIPTHDGIAGDSSEAKNVRSPASYPTEKDPASSIRGQRSLENCEKANHGSKLHQAATSSVSETVCLLHKALSETDQQYNAVVDKVNSQIACTLESLNWKPLLAYMQSSRLNINIRQVLAPGQDFPARKNV